MKTAVYENTVGAGNGAFWRLLRQDAVRRSLRWSMPIALATGLMIRIGVGSGLYDWTGLPVYATGEFAISLFVYLWLAVLFAVVIAHFNSRCGSLSLGLPLSSRSLWVVRLVAISGACLIPISILVLTSASRDTASGIGLSVPLLDVGARTAAGFILAIILFQLPAPGLYRIAGRKWYVIYVVIVSALTFTYSIVTPESWIYTVGPLILAVLIGIVAGYRLPPGFSVDTAARARGVAEADADSAAGALPFTMDRRGRIRRTWRLLRVIWRENLNTWPVWIMTALIFFIAWILTGSYYLAYHAIYEYVWLLMWCWIFISQSVKRLNRIDSLPVRRSAVFYGVIAFMMIPVGLGMLTGYLVYNRFKEEPMSQVRFRDHRVRVPFEAWEIARDGEVPEVTSPWGETYTPYGKRLFKSGSDFVVYNPFENGKKSTPEFVAMQMDRAVARVNAAAAGPEKMSSIAATAAFADSLKTGECDVTASLGKHSDLRIRTNAVIITLWILLFVLVNSIWWKRYRPEADLAATRWFAIVFFGVPIAFLLLVPTLEARGIVDHSTILAYQMVVLRTIAEAIPLSTAALWGVTVLVAIMSIVFLGRQYARAEAPAPGAGKHLLSEY